ncbi:MAG: SGNH/GDSL hydrolase family protein [Okeania sp. SIO3B5]|uniref:SGNH/GDSL hydrolase family protein n=1 Tax=Okeania sp. SIO3B5 TaxID=2607811 RepID=UPI001400C51E|nr:GDSL-type esterase/lipase family protein [Okeania sp. SIO3B5]NEO53279.1 SGNH/GDSL hydrolase family protein [Okeania sp. SIO3B5]
MNKTKIIIICLSIIILVSLRLNFLFFNRSRKFYLQLNSLQLNPLAINYYPVDPNPEETGNFQQKNIIFFGDSRARGWNSPKGFDDFNFVNRGISGQTTAQVLGRLNQHLKPLSADIVIVQVGVNDLYRIPIFPENKEIIISECKSNIKEIVRQSRQLGAVVILTTIFPIAEVPLERKFFWSPDVELAIKEVDDFIYSLENKDVIIFDTKAILANEQGKVREEYSRDFLHLNRAGYKALNEKLMPILQEL